MATTTSIMLGNANLSHRQVGIVLGLDQVIEVLAACCLPQLLGQTAAVEK